MLLPIAIKKWYKIFFKLGDFANLGFFERKVTRTYFRSLLRQQTPYLENVLEISAKVHYEFFYEVFNEVRVFDDREKMLGF